MDSLTTKQLRFVQEYMKDSCATKAAIRAGYSERYASEIGYQLLQKTTVSNEIKNLQSEIYHQLRNQFTQDALQARNVLREILDNPYSKDRDKITAAKDLLDRAGFAPVDRKQLSGPNNEPIEIKFIQPK